MTAVFTWLLPLAFGFLFGWAWGRASATSAPPPQETGDWRAGYVTGFDDAREECLRIARAHDFATIDRQLTRLDANS